MSLDARRFNCVALRATSQSRVVCPAASLPPVLRQPTTLHGNSIFRRHPRLLKSRRFKVKIRSAPDFSAAEAWRKSCTKPPRMPSPWHLDRARRTSLSVNSTTCNDCANSQTISDASSGRQRNPNRPPVNVENVSANAWTRVNPLLDSSRSRVESDCRASTKAEASQ